MKYHIDALDVGRFMYIDVILLRFANGVFAGSGKGSGGLNYSALTKKVLYCTICT